MRTLLCATVLLIGSATIASRAAADALDDYVKDTMKREQIPGLSLAIVRDGKVVKAAGYGLANVEHQVAARPETVFQSGSVGKQFTAAAVMMLVEEGKVGLDDPLLRFFEQAPATWRDIKVRHLLTHTSGLTDYAESSGAKDALVDLRRDYTEQELVQKAFSLPIEFAPGSQWSYSNSGYLVLGALIRSITGKFYGDFLQEKIFGPLGMESTRIISEADIVPNRAAGYRLEKGVLKNQEWVAPSVNTTADGSLYLTVLDLAKWDIALSREEILKRPSFAQMWTPARLENGSTYPYGLAWGLGEQRGHTLIEHGGSWQGFRAHIARYVDDQLSVIVLANLAGAPVEVIAHTVAGLLDPDLALPGGQASRPDPKPQRTAMLKETLAGWGSYRSSPTMAAGLRAAWSGTAAEVSDRRSTSDRLAKLQSFDLLAEDDLKGRRYERRGEVIRRILYYGTSAGDEAGLYRFYLTETDSVADFTWSRLP